MEEISPELVTVIGSVGEAEMGVEERAGGRATSSGDAFGPGAAASEEPGVSTGAGAVVGPHFGVDEEETGEVTIGV